MNLTTSVAGLRFSPTSEMLLMHSELEENEDWRGGPAAGGPAAGRPAAEGPPAGGDGGKLKK